jgi:hypothetical protein
VFGGTVAAGTATGCQLTTAWSLNAAYEHYWTPSVHQSFVGSYSAISYNSQANNMLCSSESGAAIAAGSAAAAIAGCNNNWSMWGVSSRLQWDVTKTFYLGVEVLYDHMNSATAPGGILTAPVALAAPNPAVFQESSMDTWAATVRMHKDFLP